MKTKGNVIGVETRHLWAVFAVSVVVVSLIAGNAWARDRDGTKLQARALALSQTHKDRLDPPEDVADWFYVKISEPGTYQMLLEASGGASVSVYNASHQSVLSKSVKGRGEKAVTLDPGVYYISVKSSGVPTSYQLKVSR